MTKSAILGHNMPHHATHLSPLPQAFARGVLLLLAFRELAAFVLPFSFSLPQGHGSKATTEINQVMDGRKSILSKVLVSLGGIEQAELEHGTILTKPSVLETLALQSHYRLYNLHDILEMRSQVSYRTSPYIEIITGSLFHRWHHYIIGP